MELKGVLVHQPWGMKGWKGKAAKLYARDRKLQLDREIAYGEFILGGERFHETYVVNKDIYLRHHFRQLTDHEIGITSFCNFGKKVPFTLKVISVRRPAPLVCHPSEEMSRIYHARNAKDYISVGARKNLLVALEDFTLLVGFRSLDQIVEAFENVPELKLIIDEKLIKTFLKTKRKEDFLIIFENMLDALPSQAESAGKLLSERLMESQPSKTGAFDPIKLFMKLLSYCPSDVGIFLPYFLNIVNIKPWDAVLLCSEIPYAYLFGEAIECSNEVQCSVRAAFTCKRDINEFIRCLKLRFMSVQDVKDELFVYTRTVNENLVEYLTPCSAFRLFLGSITRGHQMTLPEVRSFSILLILDGKGKINRERLAIPGISYLFYANEIITIYDTNKLVFVQVGVNFL